MAWLRYSDDFTKDRSWDGVSFEARWHYLALLEECSQGRYWNGALPVTRAVRCSDTSDPEKCIDELVRAGRLRREAETIHVLDAEDHVPPEGQRDENLLPRKRSNVKAYRFRQCQQGNHSKDCPRATCPEKKPVTERVTGNAGTGRDGTEKGNQPQAELVLASDPWPPTAEIPQQVPDIGHRWSEDPLWSDAQGWDR